MNKLNRRLRIRGRRWRECHVLRLATVAMRAGVRLPPVVRQRRGCRLPTAGVGQEPQGWGCAGLIQATGCSCMAIIRGDEGDQHIRLTLTDRLRLVSARPNRPTLIMGDAGGPGWPCLAGGVRRSARRPRPRRAWRNCPARPSQGTRQLFPAHRRGPRHGRCG
jgi:hypothetical protein